MLSGTVCQAERSRSSFVVISSLTPLSLTVGGITFLYFTFHSKQIEKLDLDMSPVLAAGDSSDLHFAYTKLFGDHFQTCFLLRSGQNFFD